MSPYNYKIAIIGGGIFGLNVLENLHDNFKNKIKVDLFEKEKSILSGASSNNLNRVHMGYHYPRSISTATQSLNNYYLFIKKFKNCIKKHIKSYYFIANLNSKVSFDEYLIFCNKLNLPFKDVNIKKLNFDIANVEGGIETSEALYDPLSIKLYYEKYIKNNKIETHLNSFIQKIEYKKNKFNLFLNNKVYEYDFVIDASHFYGNHLKKIFGLKAEIKKFQKTLILNIDLDLSCDTGAAIMDGEYISFLPNGFKNNFLLYDVKNSLLDSKTTYLAKSFNLSYSKKILDNQKKKIINKFNHFFPSLNIVNLIKFNIANRVLPVSNDDERISKIDINDINFLSINSTKVDHSIEISTKVVDLIRSKLI